MLKFIVHRHKPLGFVEFFGIPLETQAPPELFSREAQRIVLDPPGVVRDTIVLAIRAGLVCGEKSGEVEGVRWERELLATV